jgi:PmbA protein
MQTRMIPTLRDRLAAAVESATGKGAAAAKIRFRHGESVSVEYESGRLKTSTGDDSCTYTLELIAGGRRGTVSANDLDRLDEMVDRALALARAGSTAHIDGFPPPAAVTAVPRHAEATAALSTDVLAEACGTMVAALQDYDETLKIDAVGRRSERESLLVTSGGVCHEELTSAWSLSNMAQRTRGTDMVFAAWGRGWTDPAEFYDPQAIVAHTLEDLRRAEEVVEAPRGAATVVLPPEIVGLFLRAVFLGTNGRTVARGSSPLENRLGEKVLHEAFTLRDDPHRSGSPQAAEMDPDGVPTRPLTIIENGVLQSYLYDLDSAGLAGAEPTGHAGCSPYDPLLEPGRRTSREMIADLDDALFVRGMLGFGQSNIQNGDFSTNLALGFRVRDGGIAGRVKNTMIAGNVYDLFSGRVELSRDVDPRYRLPWIVAEGLTVSAAGAS